MDNLGNTPFIVIVGYMNGDIEYYGPFKSRRRAEVYGALAVVHLKGQRFHISELCRSFNDEGFDPI